MKDLTLDANILFDASGFGVHSHQEASMRLLTSMRDKKVALLTLDDEDLILNQYKNNMGKSFGMVWVQHMLSEDKVHQVHRARIDRKTSKLLREAHLDPEDYKYYVRTAAATDYKRIISRDRDYSPQIQKILNKRLLLKVSSAQSTCDHLHL